MTYQHTPWAFISALICLFSLTLGGIGVRRYWRQARSPELLGFIAFMCALAVTQFGVTMSYLTLIPESQLFWANFVNVIGLCGAAYALLWFALAYAGHTDFINRWTLGFVVFHLLVNITVVVAFPEFLYDANGLTTLDPVTVFGFTVEQWQFLDRTLKPPFRLFQLYVYCLVLLSGGILVRYILRRRPQLARGQILALLLGLGVPIGYNTLLFVGYISPAVNFTTQSLVVTSAAFAVAVFRYRLLEPAPVGRQQLVETMTDPVVMIDSDGCAVDCNRAARTLVDAPERWHGMTAKAFFEPFAEEMAWTEEGLPEASELTVDGDETRFLDVQVSRLRVDGTSRLGRVLVCRDITDQHQQRQQLERKNDQLDQFRSVLSHDLRNPLNVASGNVLLLRDQYDDDRLATVDEALERRRRLSRKPLSWLATGRVLPTPNLWRWRRSSRIAGGWSKPRT